MDSKGKGGGLAVALAAVGLLGFVGVVCWVVIGLYAEVQAGKRTSRERMERVMRQIEERKAAEADR